MQRRRAARKEVQAIRGEREAAAQSWLHAAVVRLPAVHCVSRWLNVRAMSFVRRRSYRLRCEARQHAVS